MYIRKLSLQNTGCVGDKRLVFDFDAPPDSAYWALMLGRNGVGKSTVLRSIALGLCTASEAAALLEEMFSDFVRSGARPREATIEIELTRKRARPVKITTRITQRKSRDYEITKNISPKSFTFSDVPFTCGYGISRSGFRYDIYDDYFFVDSVYTLFNYQGILQNPELILRRLDPSDTKKIIHAVEATLRFPRGTIALTRRGIEGKEFPAAFGPLHGWRDGHRTTLAWILDMYHWASLRGKFQTNPQSVSGIVLLDELEQHLHPSWQREIIGRLHEQFPYIQFITTTNSPLCAIGLSELKDQTCGLFTLKRQNGAISTIGPYRPPRTFRADQVLTSDLFDLETTRSKSTIWSIERYARLKSQKSLSRIEQKELRMLKRFLTKTLGSAETELQRDVEAAVRLALEKVSQEAAGEAALLEIRRQVKELSGSMDKS